MIPANLILNADDFGLDQRVSLAIAQCLDEGLINSFSVFPFRDPFHADLLRSIVERHPGARVGAHLAVADGSFRDHRGHFRDFLARYLTGRMPPSRVRALWRGQLMELAARLGGKRIAHIDSHQHLHILPGLWSAARSLQEEFRVPRLRVPYESLARSVTYRFPFGLGLQALARLRAEADGPGFIGFFSSTRFTVAANRAALRQVLAQRGRTFELMVHPALPAAEAGAAHAMGKGVGAEPSQEREIAELRALGDFFGRASRETVA